MFDHELRLDLLVTALEGGSNYWYLLKSNEFTEINQYKGDFIERLYTYIKVGGTVLVYDVENPDDILGELALDNIDFGEEILSRDYPDIYESIIDDCWDADHADIWFQLVVMGEIVFS